MKYSHQRILAVLTAFLAVFTVVLTFNPQVFRSVDFGFSDIFDFGGLTGVEVTGLSVDTPEDEGGDGFVSGDDCGFLMGTADLDPPSTPVVDGYSYTTGLGQITLSGISNDDQACVDENGYFYQDSIRESLVSHTTLGDIDFTWSSVATNNVYVDPVTGYWSGVAKRTASGLTPPETWMEIDWTCPSGYTESECDVYRVKTDTATGEVSGYAWIPAYGYVSMEGLTVELAPRTVVAYVEVISDEDVYPEDATYSNAPLADGYEYWRIKMTFVDTLTGQTLKSADLADLEMEFSSDYSIFVDQVRNAGDAVRETAFSYKYGCVDGDPYCYIEEDGEGTFNMFVYSASPTSDMVGIDDDSDSVIEEDSDRDGCRWIYESQWPGVSAPVCPGIGFFGPDYKKEDVYYLREDDRNYYLLESLSFTATFTGTYSESTIYQGGGVSLADNGEVSEGGPYIYIFNDINGNAVFETGEGEELSFKPRYQSHKFVASYGGYEYESISTDLGQKMQLVATGKLQDFSEEYKMEKGGSAVNSYLVNQVDSDPNTGSGDVTIDTRYLLIDTDEAFSNTLDDSYAEMPDDFYRGDVISNAGAMSVEEDFVIGYDTTCDPAAGDMCGSPTNSPVSPTAEQWFCDDVLAGHALEFVAGGLKSCYYTAYLPIPDPHDDPEYMSILGAINSTVEIGDFLETVAEAEDEDYSVLGSVNVATLRNDLFAMIARYTLGQTPGSGGILDLGSISSSTSVLSLMGGRLLYAEDDVYVVGGSSTFSDPVTLVVRGANVYLNQNVTGGRLGIIALEDDGTGGNLYIDPSVTDVYANIFLDGSMFSKSSTYDGDLPTWASDELRVETLLNQLYLKGSLMSRNTLGGALDLDEDGQYPLGDGTYTTDYDEALEYDLNSLRQFRLCFPIGADGLPDETLDPELCGEGENLSGYTNEDGEQIYSSLIIEYAPADDLPVFVSGAGLD